MEFDEELQTIEKSLVDAKEALEWSAERIAALEADKARLEKLVGWQPLTDVGGSLDFGDYCYIEQHRYGSKNETYIYKVVGRLESNTYVDVPVKSGEGEKIHKGMVGVVRCICCGVQEPTVDKFRVSDVRPRAALSAVKGE